MALSFHANFTNSLKRNNDIFPLVQIGGSSTIYLSTRDVTVDSQAYDGRLLNAPGITSSIDLRNRTSRTNNITIRIANNGYDATFAQRTNKAVTIYFATNGTTSAIGQCLKVFTGRVVGISKLTDKEIAVNCEDYASWRYNKILTEQVGSATGYNMPGTKMFLPLSYGDFTENTSTESSTGLCESKKLRPVKFITSDRDYLYYNEGINAQGGRPHLYVDGIDKFVPIEEAQSGTLDKFGTNNIRVNNSDNPGSDNDYFRHSVKLYPNTVAGAADDPSSISATIANITNALDETSSVVSVSAVSGSTPYVGAFGEMSGTLLGTIKSVRACIKGESTQGALVSCWIKAGDGDTILDAAVTTGNGFSSSSGAANLADGTILTFSKDVTSVWDMGVNLNGVIFGFYQRSTSGTEVLEITEMYLEFTTYIPIDTNNGKAKNQEMPDVLYIGADGTTLDGYTNPSDHGPTEVHENILVNFGPGASNIDSTTQAAVEGEFNANGLVRCTIDDPNMTVQDALNKLQKEAGFISYVRPSDGKVYYLLEDASDKSSDPGIEAVLTTAMYRNPVFGTIPLSQMLWKVTYNYDKHPAKGTYLTGSTTQDTTTKGTYDFGDNDGVATFNLDWVNETRGPVNLINLFKYQRMTAQCEILDPAKWTLEIGDIITFSNPPADFRLRDSSAAYTDYQFRITETTRTVNSLKIKAMEVYKA